MNVSNELRIRNGIDGDSGKTGTILRHSGGVLPSCDEVILPWRLESRKEREDLNRYQRKIGVGNQRSDDDHFRVERTGKQSVPGPRVVVVVPKHVSATSKRPVKSGLPGVFSVRDPETSPTAFPPGTEQLNEPGREIIRVPPQGDRENIFADRIPLLGLQVFPLALIQAGVFGGYKTLNRMQSAVFDVAFKSNENMLVCAPTGSGKTDVALMAILRTVWTHSLLKGNDTVEIEDSFMVVYIAPMKALAGEITAKFSKRLGGLGLVVKECTGDIRLKPRELERVHVLVATPEKWDVMTRQPVFAESCLGARVKAVILDEVHLLQEDRGAVLETLVARTMRFVEQAQRVVRLVGLSATLPNFLHVAAWLRVNPYKGLFYFDDSFRPVPLSQTLIGVSNGAGLDVALMDGLRSVLRDGHQSIVFVHARGETMRVARLVAGALLPNKVGNEGPESGAYIRRISHSELRSLVGAHGVAVHHAGLCRSDRKIAEALFINGTVRILVSTATLAWGVNLPARAVFIRGTDVFDVDAGKMKDLSVLDVLQIFGRAGRPSFDTQGEATLITMKTKLSVYQRMLLSQSMPIESTFCKHLDTHLNAEIFLGTVSSHSDAVAWLSYTYLHVRMRENPRFYGIDTGVGGIAHSTRTSTMIKDGLDRLRTSGLVNITSLGLESTTLGGIVSRFYLDPVTATIFHDGLELLPCRKFSVLDFLWLCACAAEYSGLRIRSADDSELSKLVGLEYGSTSQTRLVKQHDKSNFVPLGIPKQIDWTIPASKVLVLLQAWLCHWDGSSSSLAADMIFVEQNAGRLLRALFEIAVDVIRDVEVAIMALETCLCFESRILPTNIQSDDSLSILVATIRNDCTTVLGTSLQIKIKGTSLILGRGIWIFIDAAARSAGEKRRILWAQRVSCRSRQSATLVLRVSLEKDEWKKDNDNECSLYVRVVSDSIPGCKATMMLKEEYYDEEFESSRTRCILPIPRLLDPSIVGLDLTSRGIYSFNTIQSQLIHPFYYGTENVLVAADVGSGISLLAEISIISALRRGGNVICVVSCRSRLLVLRKRWVQISKEESQGGQVEEILNESVGLNTIPVGSGYIFLVNGGDCDWKMLDSVLNVPGLTLLVIDRIHDAFLGEGRRTWVFEAVISVSLALAIRRNVRIVGTCYIASNLDSVAAWLHVRAENLFVFDRDAAFKAKTWVAVPQASVAPVAFFSHVGPRLVQLARKRLLIVIVLTRKGCVQVATSVASRLALDEKHIFESETEMFDMIENVDLRRVLGVGVGFMHAGLGEGDQHVVGERLRRGRLVVLVTTGLSIVPTWFGDADMAVLFPSYSLSETTKEISISDSLISRGELVRLAGVSTEKLYLIGDSELVSRHAAIGTDPIRLVRFCSHFMSLEMACEFAATALGFGNYKYITEEELIGLFSWTFTKKIDVKKVLTRLGELGLVYSKNQVGSGCRLMARYGVGMGSAIWKCFPEGIGNLFRRIVENNFEMEIQDMVPYRSGDSIVIIEMCRGFKMLGLGAENISIIRNVSGPVGKRLVLLWTRIMGLAGFDRDAESFFGLMDTKIWPCVVDYASMYGTLSGLIGSLITWQSWRIGKFVPELERFGFLDSSFSTVKSIHNVLVGHGYLKIELVREEKTSDSRLRQAEDMRKEYESVEYMVIGRNLPSQDDCELLWIRRVERSRFVYIDLRNAVMGDIIYLWTIGISVEKCQRAVLHRVQNNK